jgi:hypothetical protein
LVTHVPSATTRTVGIAGDVNAAPSPVVL